MRKKLMIVITIIMVLTCAFTACVRTEIKGDVISVEPDLNGVKTGITRSDIGRVKLFIKYESGATETIDLKEEYIVEADRYKLSVIGEQVLNIEYKGIISTFNIVFQPEKDNYTVTFKETGDTYMDVIQVPKGGTFNIANPTWSGHKFIGWYYDENGYIPYNGAIKSDVILYGYWEPKNYDSRNTRSSLINNLAENYNNNLNPSQKYYLENNKDGTMPSIGDINVLIIPVLFKDTDTDNIYLKGRNGDYKVYYDKAELENILFGTGNSDIGLSEYYAKSSYNKLNIKGNVAEWVRLSHDRSYYASFNNEIYGSTAMVDEAISLLALSESGINFSDYDNDNDGIIDGIYIMPYGIGPNDSSNEKNVYHAYTYDVPEDKLSSITKNSIQNKEIGLVVSFASSYLSSLSYGARVVIHETGHKLGLTDYYDYDNTVGEAGAMGGIDMMDYNLGDHNPASKLLLGWITPTFISECDNDYVNLRPFVDSGDALFISKNADNNIFGEFYIVFYYQLSGINDVPWQSHIYGSNHIAVMHVDFTLNNNNELTFKYDNSYTPFRFIKYLTNNGSTVNLGNFFHLSDTFASNTVKNQFNHNEATLLKFKVTELKNVEATLRLQVGEDNVSPKVTKITTYGTYIKSYFDERLKTNKNINILIYNNIDKRKYMFIDNVMMSSVNSKECYIMLDYSYKELGRNVTINFGNSFSDYSGNLIETWVGVL